MHALATTESIKPDKMAQESWFNAYTYQRAAGTVAVNLKHAPDVPEELTGFAELTAGRRRAAEIGA